MINYKLKDRTIYICNYQTKKDLLEASEEILDIKFYEKNKFIKKMLFDYDEKTIDYVMNNYNYTYLNTKIILDNLIYLMLEFDYKNDKILFLQKLYNELLEENLLIISDNFYNFAKSYNIVILGYDYVDNMLNFVLEKFNNVEFITSDSTDKIVKEYSVFSSYDEEIKYCFNEIALLLDNNISLSNVKLVIPDDKYLYYINKYSLLFNIKLPSEVMLNTTNEAIEFLRLLKLNTSLEEIIVCLNKEFVNKGVINKIIGVVNKYNWFKLDSSKLYDRFKYYFKNTSVYKEVYDNQLEIISLENYVPTDNKHIFLVGFNEGKYPKGKGDDDYFSNIEKVNLGINTSDELYNLELVNLYNKLLGIKNLVITYPRNYKNEVLYPHGFCNRETFIESLVVKKNISYSKKSDVLYLASLYDDYYKYNIINDDLLQLHNNFDSFYNEYDNKFTNLSSSQIEVLKKKELSLSYTKIDLFYKCSFAYYLKYILKIDKFESSFPATVGNLYHEVLKNYYKDKFVVEDEVALFLKSNNFSKKEEMLLIKLIEILKESVEIINEQEKFINYKDKLSEFKYDIKIDDLTTFVGIIDKIYTNESNDVVIVDYKSGKSDINYKNIKYGLDLQLFVYIYLLMKSDKAVVNNIVGFYLQYLINFDYNFDVSKSKEVRNLNSMKLNGYSIDDIDLIENFDNSIENSNVIKSMKLKRDGEFYHNAKVISKELIYESIRIVENHIINANNNIRNAKFKINPKMLDKGNVSCEFCDFNDVCFTTYNDLVDLSEVEEELKEVE